MTFDLRALTADRVGLAVDVHPSRVESAPTLVLIPGLGASRAVYTDLIPLLAEFRRVVTYDPRGIGDSDMSDPPWTLSQLAADVAVVIAAAGGAAPVDVFGASMGGVVAQHLALDRPELVRRLVLAATGPGGTHTIARNGFARDRLLGKGATTPEQAYRRATTVLYSAEFRTTHPEFIEAEVAYRTQHPIRPRAFAAQAAAGFGHDEWERLASLHAPTLVLHGSDDLVMPLRNAELLAARIPGAKYHWFVARGHLFFHEDGHGTAAVVRQFLEG